MSILKVKFYQLLLQILRKIGIKENNVLLDTLDVVVYLIKNELIRILFNIPFIDPIYYLIDGLPWSISA
ncbi:hypothetical protein Bmayo_06335 (plasmid) [Borreliella mayonii]|uniref:Uncharacterized protein n=1 Tax=Borreliella mayonii TaxID=1674146 RepID=A0AAC9KY63_9SPIR|nr:hypothetical protein A7X70_06290 [Borreliella mayonii]APT00348.1 hypothetical protein Bmayo_06335 [Borreliella mayonii]